MKQFLCSCARRSDGRVARCFQHSCLRRSAKTMGAASLDRALSITSGCVQESRSSNQRLLHIVEIAQHITAAPDGFDVIFTHTGQRQFLAQLADEDVDDF